MKTNQEKGKKVKIGVCEKIKFANQRENQDCVNIPVNLIDIRMSKGRTCRTCLFYCFESARSHHHPHHHCVGYSRLLLVLLILATIDSICLPHFTSWQSILFKWPISLLAKWMKYAWNSTTKHNHNHVGNLHLMVKHGYFKSQCHGQKRSIRITLMIIIKVKMGIWVEIK